MKKRFVLLKTGDALERVKRELGDFDRFFLDALKQQEQVAQVIEAHHGEPLPKLMQFDALIVSGSPSSVTDRAPWADQAADLLRAALDANKYILGVCYGHQLLAHAIGGVVVKNINGYESGTINVELTRAGHADRLFGPIARANTPLAFHSTHSDAVISLPAHARTLAWNKTTAIQAFAVGERAWGVQFHPEFSADVMRLYVEGRTELIASEAKKRGLDAEKEVERVTRSVRDTPAGPMLLRAFAEAVG